MSWLLAFLGFAALIILHELGHFGAAKAVGMRVERFSLFFPPLLARIRRGETEYAVGAIPLGGYVKITGMNPAEEIPPEVAHRAYYRQPVWKRIVVIGAGPLVNIVLALVLLTSYLLIWGAPVGQTTNTVEALARDGAAAQVLRLGDKVVAVDGKRGEPQVLQRQVATHRCAGEQVDGCRAATPAEVTFVRDGRARTVEITPSYNAEAGRPLLGFSYGVDRVFEPVDGFGDAVTTSLDQMWFFTTTTVETIAGIFDPEKREEISGVVGSYETTRQAIELSTDRAVFLLARDLALARDHQPVPVPAARRRPHLLGARREAARPRDPVQRDGAGRLHRLRARDRAVRGGAHERHREAHRRGLRGQVAL